MATTAKIPIAPVLLNETKLIFNIKLRNYKLEMKS